MRKFPDRMPVLDVFLVTAMTALTIVRVPDEPIADEARIRDEKDRPIFRAAVRAEADAFLTGDKDFLESGIRDQRILSPSEFIGMSMHGMQ